jgi:hypothetical protein
VQHVLPREDGTAERGLPQRVPGALAVRHVQERPDLRVSPAAREVGGAARAAVERVAGAAEHARELVPDALEARELRVDLVDLLREPDPDRLLATAAAGEAGVLLDLGEREAEALRLLHRLDEAHRLLVVLAVPVRAAGRLLEQTATLVVAKGLDVHSRPPCKLADSHVYGTLGLYQGTDVKRDGRVPQTPSCADRLRHRRRRVGAVGVGDPPGSHFHREGSRLAVVPTAGLVYSTSKNVR